MAASILRVSAHTQRQTGAFSGQSMLTIASAVLDLQENSLQK
jgi:hypothetical protein